MENQLVLVDPKEYGLEESKAGNIEKSFLPKQIELEAFQQQYSEVITKELTPATFKEARELRLKLVKVRTGIADVHKSEKAFYLASGKYVDALKNKLTTPIEQMEERLKDIEDYEKRIEAERKALLKADRIKAFEPYGTDTSFLPLDEMTEEQFQGQLDIAKTAFEKKQEDERKAEEERIEREKKEEADRLEKERLDKMENERRVIIAPYAQFNTGNSDLRNMSDDDFKQLCYSLEEAKEAYEKEQEEIKAENERLKKEREEAAKIQAKKDAEAKKEQDRLAKIAADEKAKSDALAKEKSDREAKEKADKEAESEVERLKQLAPDKDKINALFIAIRDFQFPEVESAEAKKIVSEVQDGMKIILTGIKNLSKELK